MAPFATTAFLGAFLLFFVQPLLGRFALPWFGGSASVWTGCMAFFQVALLGGYAYADVLSRRVAPRTQARVHLAVVAVAGAVLGAQALVSGAPLAPWEGFRPGPQSAIAVRLVLMLAVTAGVPFVAIAATAPLVQQWHRLTGASGTPYRLYALSNAGSLCALLVYPFVVEPTLSRTAQAWLFLAGFLAYGVALAASARQLARAPSPVGPPRVLEGPVLAAPAPGLARRAGWLGLSALGSALLVATTQQLSLDLTAGPYLWVLPLAVYLLTFILCFEREGLYRRAVWFPLLALCALGTARGLLVGPHQALLTKLALSLGALFTGCMVCHGELYRARPGPERLGGFYLWMATGGALGSLLLYVGAPLLLRSLPDFALALGATVLLAAAITSRASVHRARWAGTFGLTLTAGVVWMALDPHSGVTLESRRGFFGVLRVVELKGGKPPQAYRALLHGRIVHGLQRVDPATRRQGTAYYAEGSGLGAAVLAQHERRGAGAPLRMGMVGLGVGASAALLGPGDSLRVYEIDPDVIALARGEGGHFHYLAETQARVELVEGDARLSLERELAAGAPQHFDLLVLDAFSGDAVPTHLLTREAVQLYLRHLTEGGVLAFHISNLHINLLPVLAAHARALGLTLEVVETAGDGLTLGASWALLSAEPAFFRAQAFTRTPPQPVPVETWRKVAWTDEQSSVLPLLHLLD